MESDSMEAIKLIKEGNAATHPLRVMINDAHAILGRTGAQLNHVSRTANQCADFLARLGAE